MSYRVVPLDVLVASGHVALDPRAGPLLRQQGPPAGRDAARPRGGLRLGPDGSSGPAAEQQQAREEEEEQEVFVRRQHVGKEFTWRRT